MDKLMRKINTSPKPKQKFSPSRSKVFGVPLKLLLDSKSTNHIPAIVSNLCQCLLKHGTEVEGIFRINGSARLIDLFKRDLEFSPNSDLHPTENVEIYALAGVLKLFLRELPGGVIPEEYTLKLIKTIRGDGEDMLECLQRLQELIPSLPRENRRLLHYLCRFLNRIAANEASNKMSCQGLGILFGPCIFRFDVRSQGLRNQGLVNQAMTVLIQHCDTIFLSDQTDETFALGDDIADSWRSATSGLNAEPMDLKIYSAATSCSSSSVSRSFYSTLFSGRSQERLITENTNIVSGTDPPVLPCSLEYKAVKPVNPGPWSNPPSARLNPSKRDSTSAPQTISGRLRTPESITLQLERHTVTCPSGPRTVSTTSTLSSDSSSPDVNPCSAGSESPKSTHSEARISQSEPSTNLSVDFNFPDSSNQLALDLAHLLTSFGSANGLDFPSAPLPGTHSPLREPELHLCESNGFRTSSGVERACAADKRVTPSVETPVPKAPMVVVSRPSTCGDHEPQVSCLYASDYEVCMYELPAMPDSCPSNTTATTTAPTLTALGKGVTDSRTADPSDGDLLLEVDSPLQPPDNNQYLNQITANPTGEKIVTAGPPSGNLNQAISACLDMHVFASGLSRSSKRESEQKLKPEHKTSLPHLPSSTVAKTSGSRSSLLSGARHSKCPQTQSTSSFPVLPSAQAIQANRTSPIVTKRTGERRGLVSKCQPSHSAPESPLERRGKKRSTAPSVTAASLSPSTRSRSKYLIPPTNHRLLSRSTSSPLVYLSGASGYRRPYWLRPYGKRSSKKSTISRARSPNLPAPRVHPIGESASDFSLLMRSQVSTSAPLIPSPPTPCGPFRQQSLPGPRSVSCSQLPREQDRKQGESSRVSAKMDAVCRSQTRTRTCRLPVVRSHSFHDLAPCSNGSQVYVMSKSASFGSLRGAREKNRHKSTNSSQDSWKSSRSNDQLTEPKTAVSLHTNPEAEVHGTIARDSLFSTVPGHQSDKCTPRPTSRAEMADAEGLNTRASLQSFCELLTAVLEEQRRCCGRPTSLVEMTSEQIFQEKIDLQKGLLYFERLHGRPADSESKRIMKPLYERYRQVKRMLRTDLTNSVLNATPKIEEPKTCAEADNASKQPIASFNSHTPKKSVPTTGTNASPVSRISSSFIRDGLSPFPLQNSCTGSVAEHEDSRFSALSDYRLYDSVVSSLPASPKGEPESRPSVTDLASRQQSAAFRPETDAPSGPQGEHLVTQPVNLLTSYTNECSHSTVTKAELLVEWKRIWGKKRALQHELREFEISIEQVKGRPPNKADRRPMRDKYHEYRSLKRTLESLALRLNMEPVMSTGPNPDSSDPHVRTAQCPKEPEMSVHPSGSVIRTP